MQSIETSAFLTWARSRGIVLDMRYSPPQCLVYETTACSRFWTRPDDPARWPFMVMHMLAGMQPFLPCHLWVRGGGSPRRLVGHKVALPSAHNLVHDAILDGAGVPADFIGALRFVEDEVQRVLAIAYAQMAFGSSVNDDLFIVPEHARAFLHVGHHDVVHAEFAQDAELERFVAHMAAKGFELPHAVPDATFKKPEWMR